MKRTAAVFVSIVMTVAFGTTALAGAIHYNINDVTEDIEIGEEGNTNTYVITGSGGPSNHRIIVNGVTSTTITLQNVNIVADGDSAMDIGDDADVGLIVSGTNCLTVTNSNTGAGIHISGGSLTISGTDADEDVLTVLNTSSNGAVIGSNDSENFSGTITIDGGVTVNAESIHNSYDGAAIGSGQYGEMSGDITINEGSVVNAITQDDGAGIGTGYHGEMSGNITINGGEVNAVSYGYGAGIGAGDVGGYEEGAIGVSGTITINGGDVYAYSDDGGAGVGSGDYGEMSGTITINGGNVTAISDECGAGIGSGDYDMTGQIVINGGNVNASSSASGVGIGAGTDLDKLGHVNGDITIHGDAIVTLGDGNIIGSTRESDGTIYLYKGSVINGITVTNVEDLKAEGILNDNMEVVLLEEETSQGHSYSLGKLSTTSRIKAAKTGDKVYIYESELSKGKIPYYVLETLSKADNVTLVLVCENGETVEFNSSNVPEKGKKAFFTVDELLDMAK